MSLNLTTYQEFVSLLELSCSDVNNIDAADLRQRLNELKQFFLEKIVTLTDLTSQQQSYHTEMSKQLGLLEIDVMFFQGAKQAATRQAKLNKIIEKLNTLIRYCQVLIDSE